MARPLRIEYEGAVYHITSRGNERKEIYRDTGDRTLFLAVLRQVNQRYSWLCHAYCLMDNHYHLLIETPESNLSQGMRQLNGLYTQGFNRGHDRVGHVFQGRYRAIVIEKESHLLEVCRYVVLNPVRAKVVERPQDWSWSSYGGTAGLASAHPCLTVDWLLGQFAPERTEAQRMYQVFVGEGIQQVSPWEGVRQQIVLGGEGFTARMQALIEGYKEIPEIATRQRFLHRPSLEQLLPMNQGEGKPERDRRIREAVEQFHYSQQEVARHTGLHYTTISRIMKEC
jgi:REP element-mobilizing transposase RayT